jgi:glycosyltransferase involved in cell wall biosynthesis
MKIGINALFIRPGWHAGTEVYLRNLLHALPILGNDHEFYLFTNKENHDTFSFTASNFKKVLIPIQANIKPLRVLAEQVVLPGQARRLNLSVLHGPGYTSPALHPCPCVVTIHDMQYRYYPEIYPKGQYLFFKTFIPLSAKTSTSIITDANSTKLDLQKFLGIKPEKVNVIHLAPDSRYYQKPSLSQIQAIRARYKLPDEYILTVSSFRPQKNTLRLLEAYRQIKQRGLKHKLVLVGRKLDPYSKAQELIDRLELNQDVIMTDYVPDDDLPAIYAGAGVFAFPSFFEGFGIPVLEAMACGIPVVLSNVASMPEAGGKAGYYIDPYNVDEIAEGLYKLLTEPELHQTLSAKGYAHARNFSWERVARQTLQVYERAAGLK